MLIYKVLSFLFLIFILNGCHTANLSNGIIIPYSKGPIPKGYGIVVLSITYDASSHPNLISISDTNYDHFSYKVRQIGTNKLGSFWYKSSNFSQNKGDFSDISRTGLALAYLVPVGNFELYNYGCSSPTIYGTSTISPINDLSIRFTVEEGQATYLGEIHAKSIWRKNSKGATVIILCEAYFNDQYEDDIIILKNKYPIINTLTISKQLLQYEK